MSKTTSADGTTIAFDRYGDGGPAVVIVEGAFCDRRTSTRLAEQLATRFTVYAYDRRGRGDSGDTEPYAVRREVEDLAAVITEAGGSASVYGMSSGAVLGVEAALQGVSIPRLALYEPPVIADETRRAQAAVVSGKVAECIADGRRGDAAAAFLTEGVRVPAEMVAQMRNAPMWAGLEAIAHTLVYDNLITADDTVLTRAAAVTVPALVLAGGSSPDFLTSAAKALAEAIPGGELRTLAGQTHDVDPASLAPVVADYFGRP